MDTYEDILRAERPQSRRAKMDMSARAAQFAPFAALSGYEEAVAEAGRLTQEEILLMEDRREELDRILRQLEQLLPLQPEVKLAWFRPDERKNGGAVVERQGRVKKLDRQEEALVLQTGEKIPFFRIINLENL